VQERMTRQIADFLQEVLHPKGVAVVVEGAHMCSMMRGVKKANASMTTSTMGGAGRIPRPAPSLWSTLAAVVLTSESQRPGR
jgi:hypothetical protein